MADRLSKEQRRRNMAAIRGRDTLPELIVRRFLWGHGYRYRLNHLRLPGKPDLVLRRFRTCIFVNGCFWHGHRLAIDEMGGEGTGRRDGEAMSLEIANSECCKVPKSNREFWVKKIVRNHERDREVQVRLSRMGWHCITVWECQLGPDTREATLNCLATTLDRLFLNDHKVKGKEI